MVAKRKSKSRAKKRATRKSPRRKTKSKAKKSKGKKKPFGGYSISFAGRTETVEQIFGKGRIVPSQMTKKIWQFIKAKKLASS